MVRSFFGKSFNKETTTSGFNISESIASFILDATSISMDPYFSIKRILFGKNFAENHFISHKEKKCLEKV